MDANPTNPMIFSPEAQSEFWGAMDPDFRAFIAHFEKKETFTYDFTELPELFIRMAHALPRVAQLPIDEKSQDILVKLIPLLTCMPFGTCIFAIHWLNNEAGESPIGWGTLCYLEATNITNNVSDHQHYDLARQLVERLSTIMRSRRAHGIAAQWPFKSR